MCCIISDGFCSERFLVVALLRCCSAGAIVHAEEGMWTFDNPPLKQLQAKYNFTSDAGMARSSASVERAIERRRIGIVCKPRWTAADKSSRSARAIAEEFDRRARLPAERILCRNARTRR